MRTRERAQLPDQWTKSLRTFCSDMSVSEDKVMEDAKNMYASYKAIHDAVTAEIEKKHSDDEAKEREKLKELIEWIEADSGPFDVQKINLLTVYAADALLTMDARRKQARMIWITGILYVVGIGIMVACPLFAGATALAYGAGWGMAMFLTGVLLSKVEGIAAALATMQAASEGACRQPWKEIDTVHSSLEKKRGQLSKPLQTTILDLKRCSDAAQKLKKTGKQANGNFDEQGVPERIANLQMWAVRQDEESQAAPLSADFDELITAMEELQQSAVPEEQAAWVELVKCLTPLAKHPYDTEALKALEQKSAELEQAADTRSKQDAAKKFAKAALYISLAITVTCIAIIAIAMLGYGLAATSAVVMTADTFILISKIMFWTFGAGGTAAGVVDTKKCCQCFQKKSPSKKAADAATMQPREHLIDVNDSPQTGKVVVSSKTALQKISVFAKKIHASAASLPPQTLGQNLT